MFFWLKEEEYCIARPIESVYGDSASYGVLREEWDSQRNWYSITRIIGFKKVKMQSSITKKYCPKRIICLTEEPTELLYLLGEQDRIVGISGFTVRPAIARQEKPKVSTFIDAKIDEILDLKPDLVIGFSDIQADIARELIAKGVTVWINNHRSVEEILSMMYQLGALVGKTEETLELINGIRVNISEIKAVTDNWENKPKVYFEEWYDPMISGIQWVSEIVELAGGIDVFSELGKESLAKNRIIRDSDLVVVRNPDIILASWCGKKLKREKITNRSNWTEIRAVQENLIYDIDSSVILQPGPASLMDGLPLIHNLFKEWVSRIEK